LAVHAACRNILASARTYLMYYQQVHYAQTARSLL